MRSIHSRLPAVALPPVRSAADADGPDYYRATGMGGNGVLNLRSAPSALAKVVGTIPPDAACVRNLCCRGGLSFQDYSTLSPAEQAWHLKRNPRWCQVEYRGTTGWVAARYLAEGDCP